ncbi:MAG: SDR family oxidoreductase [Clostridia bacterium]|nr:SDR family oxidoreductase [Clostridia bacterium]
MNFFGKTAFITGAAKGIGRAIALGFAKNGADIIIADINETYLKETAEQARALGVKVKIAVFDVADELASKNAIKEAEAEFGKIDILVNNAGIYPASDFINSTSEQWKRLIDINIMGSVYPTQAVLPGMIERGYGRIVNIGSVAGVYGLGCFVDYSMTKGAIIAMTKALAKVVADKGVTVNCISPGSINVTDRDDVMLKHSFTGRPGTPEELANAVLFVASEEASYISGQNYQVDGCRRAM